MNMSESGIYHWYFTMIIRCLVVEKIVYFMT